MSDKPMTFRRDKIRPAFGRMDDATMLRVGRALAEVRRLLLACGDPAAQLSRRA